MKATKGERRTGGSTAGSGGISWAGPVVALLIGGFMTFLDTSIVNVAIATIMNVFSTNAAAVQWISTIYMLILGIVVPVSAWLGDRFGYKRLYLASMVLFVLGSLLCSLSWNLEALIMARGIQAIGGGLMVPTMMTLIFRIVPRDRIGSGMGVFMIAMLVAPAIGPTLGGYLVEYVGWRWIFTINIPLGILGFILATMLLPEIRSKDPGRLDLGGALSSATGLFCLLLAISKAPDWGWDSEPVVILLVVAFLSLLLFVVIELSVEKPLLELRLFKYPSFTMANLMIIVVSIGMFAALFYIPLFLQSLTGLGAMETGLIMMPASIAETLMMPIVGRLYDKTGPRAIAVAGLLLMSAFNLLFRNLGLATATSTISLWMVLRGFFLPLAYNPAQISFLAEVPTELVGRASAITNILGRVASSLGIAVLTSIVSGQEVRDAARLSWGLDASNPFFQAWLHSEQRLLGGGAEGAATSIGLLRIFITKLATVKAMDDIFVITSIITLLGLVPALFLKKSAASKRTAAMEA